MAKSILAVSGVVFVGFLFRVGHGGFFFALLWFFVKNYIPKKSAFAQENKNPHICQIKS